MLLGVDEEGIEILGEELLGDDDRTTEILGADEEGTELLGKDRLGIAEVGDE